MNEISSLDARTRFSVSDRRWPNKKKIAILALGLALAGTSVAAATGLFDSQAKKAFESPTARYDTQGTVLDRPSVIEPDAEHRSSVLQALTPDGSQVELWNTPTSNDNLCLAVLYGETPGSLPDKPYDQAFQGGCTPSFEKKIVLGGSGLWISPHTGQQYMAIAGRAHGAADVSVKTSDELDVAVTVEDGFFLFFLPYGSFEAGYTVTALDAHRNVVESFEKTSTVGLPG